MTTDVRARVRLWATDGLASQEAHQVRAALKRLFDRLDVDEWSCVTVNDVKLWANGFTCVRCGQGFYDGYDVETNYERTMPCQKCGHSMPAEMTQAEWQELIHFRDKYELSWSTW
jgi:hypothetical protein